MADTVQIPMPQMGESVSEGTILTWHKQEGDWVDKDETIVEVSTDKVDAEVPAPQAGKLVKILAQEDETVEVGQALAELEPGEAPAGDGAAPKKEPTTVAAAGGNGRQPPRRAARRRRTATATPPASADTPSTPVARRVAAAHGIDLEQVSGSGTGGKVVKEDVLAHIERNGGDGAERRHQPRPSRPPEPTLKPLRGGDAVLARYMKESLEIPTATSFRTLEVDTLDRRRRQLNEALKVAQRDMKVSFTHLIGYAIAVAVRDHPAMGHSFARGGRQAAADRARVREPRARRGRAAQGRLAHADRARHQGRRQHGLRRVPRGLRGDDRQDPRRVAVTRRPAGSEHHAHQSRAASARSPPCRA